MAVIVLSLAGVLVLLAVGLIVWYSHLTAKDRIVASHTLQRTVVTLKTGETFDGLVRDADARTLVLVKASSMTQGKDPIPVDGALYLDRADVAYLQRP